MAKKVIRRVVKLQIPSGQANPAPPIGTVLGPTGVDMNGFCQQFNEQTKENAGMVVTAQITIYEDRSFSFIVKSPPAVVLIKKAVGLQKGSSVPHRDKVGTITKVQLEEIAKIKMKDLNANDIEAAINIIAGTARSMGVQVAA